MLQVIGGETLAWNTRPVDKPPPSSAGPDLLEIELHPKSWCVRFLA